MCAVNDYRTQVKPLYFIVNLYLTVVPCIISGTAVSTVVIIVAGTVSAAFAFIVTAIVFIIAAWRLCNEAAV